MLLSQLKSYSVKFKIISIVLTFSFQSLGKNLRGNLNWLFGLNMSQERSRDIMYTYVQLRTLHNIPHTVQCSNNTENIAPSSWCWVLNNMGDNAVNRDWVTGSESMGPRAAASTRTLLEIHKLESFLTTESETPDWKKSDDRVLMRPCR